MIEDNQQRTHCRGFFMFPISTIRPILQAFWHWYCMSDGDHQQCGSYMSSHNLAVYALSWICHISIICDLGYSSSFLVLAYHVWWGDYVSPNLFQLLVCYLPWNRYALCRWNVLSSFSCLLLYEGWWKSVPGQTEIRSHPTTHERVVSCGLLELMLRE